MSDPIYHIDDILQEKEEYALTIFNQQDIMWLESRLLEKRGYP